MTASDLDPTPTVLGSTRASTTTYLLRRLAVVALLAAVALGAAAVLTGRAGASLNSVRLTGGDDGVSAPPDPGTTIVGTTDADADSDDAGQTSPSTSTPTSTPTSLPTDSDTGPDDVAAPVAGIAPDAPDRASRLVAQTPTRVLDTRAAATPPPSPGETHTVEVPGDATAVALSVTLIEAERSGSVVVDGRAGAVEAIAVGGPGSAVTNLVIVPVVGDEATVRSSAGGHLVVDVVGRFEQAPDGAADGRFVALDGARITSLETAVDGRETALAFEPTVPADATAVLAVITADVGADGGIVRLGPEADAYDQQLMWGPAGGTRQVRGLALIEPDEAGTAALRYDGGSALTVDAVGYFTGDGAEVAVEGLYVPSGPRLLYTGPIGPDQPVVLRDVRPGTGIGLATVASRTDGAGRLWSVLTPIADGSVEVAGSADLEADITLLGVFVDGS